MAEYPSDVPRLRTIERYLLLQLAAVQRAIEKAETGITTKPADAPPRWSITWKRARVGEIRVGTVHRADCWMAPTRQYDARGIFEVRRREGQRLEMCDTCKPRLP